jgi:hypothetical protein
MTIGRILCAAGVAAVIASGSAFAQGNSGCSGTIQGGGGQDSCNAYGLCKAYFSGSPTGQAHKHAAPPFRALVDAACGGTQDSGACDQGMCQCMGSGECMNVDTCVADFCPDANPGGHGKNPSDGSPGQHK